MSTLELLEISGKSNDGTIVNFTYIGIQFGLTYIQPFVRTNLVNEDYSVIRRETINEIDLELIIKNCTSDLLIIATNKDTIFSLKDQDSYIMPFRVHQIVDTSKGMEGVAPYLSKREKKRNIKLREQYNLDYFVTYNDEDYYKFYNTMHKPTMENRYGGLARSVEIQKGYEEIFKQGLLFLITKDNIPVSGSVSMIDRKNNWLNARLIGVLNGNDYFREIGAQNFVYHAIIDWACKQDIDIVDFQGCEPFLTKGTFQYKKRFATKVILPPNNLHDKRLLVKANFKSNAIRDFFYNNPIMIIDENDNIGAGYFTFEELKPRLELPYDCPGINYHKIYNISNIPLYSK